MKVFKSVATKIIIIAMVSLFLYYMISRDLIQFASLSEISNVIWSEIASIATKRLGPL